MQTLPIPEMEQIDAMLDGTVYDLLEKYVANPHGVDFRRFLTVKRETFVGYLSANPSLAESYFQKQLASQETHDVERIFQQESEYVVVSMFHGQPKSPRHFRTLTEAVAEVVLLNHGMY